MHEAALQELIEYYELTPGDAEALREALLVGQGRPVALVNLLALREDGGEALMRYAAVSAERLRAVGGEFVFQGLSAGSLWGEGTPYNVVVVGRYPDGDAVLALLSDPQYRTAYADRSKAVAEQRVLVSVPLA